MPSFECDSCFTSSETSDEKVLLDMGWVIYPSGSDMVVVCPDCQCW